MFPSRAGLGRQKSPSRGFFAIGSCGSASLNPAKTPMLVELPPIPSPHPFEGRFLQKRIPNPSIEESTPQGIPAGGAAVGAGENVQFEAIVLAAFETLPGDRAHGGVVGAE